MNKLFRFPKGLSTQTRQRIPLRVEFLFGLLVTEEPDRPQRGSWDDKREELNS